MAETGAKMGANVSMDMFQLEPIPLNGGNPVELGQNPSLPQLEHVTPCFARCIAEGAGKLAPSGSQSISDRVPGMLEI